MAAQLPSDTKQLTIAWDATKGDRIRKGNTERTRVTLTYLSQHDSKAGMIQAALVVGIDLNRYRVFLESRGY